ncbi:translation elongation factor 2 [Wallemia mellicola]|uniref:Ribosome assembly protein 1 n=1 Tax=Wallemia mellicola TaxID=1708541 RepID=A0AB74K880_9BASI|nr:translation elongation factor 2 [Wallemia mellicola]
MSKKFADKDSTRNVRNLCIAGHVDHGKTAYADSLLAANNIISSRMAGKLRFLDSREDEQQRGITMESSAVSLGFKLLRQGEDGQAKAEDYMINMIDTPGHVDFSSEVSTAARLCDGVLIMVDVVEGVCTQTISVLQQAYADRLRPILVINKMDRLITELKLAPSEAYHHLVQLIEAVNAVIGSFFASDKLADDYRWRELSEQQRGAFVERDDQDLYFSPEKGNVLFASAADGWAFRVSKFAQIYAGKLGCKEDVLRKCLWGDFYFDPKTKRLIGKKAVGNRPLKPLFVQFVLDNIWAAYDAIHMNHDMEKVNKIINALNIRVHPRELKTRDTKTLLFAIFTAWLPLASATFSAVVDVIPQPSQAQSLRLPKMLYPLEHHPSSIAKNDVERAIYGSISDNAPVVSYVSKMFAVPANELPENRRRGLTAEEMRERGRESREKAMAVSAALGATGMSGADELSLEEAAKREQEKDTQNDEKGGQEEQIEESMIGFARIYSGNIRVNDTLKCLLPKYNSEVPPNNAHNLKHVQDITIKSLYMMMGRDLVPVSEVPAGNVFAIGGLDGVVLRNATLITPDNDNCFINLASVVNQVAPIVRVALEPGSATDMGKLVNGMKLLNQADPCVEVLQQETGEHVILTAGELHLERCLKDLRERFAKCSITPSKPIVPFRETAVKGQEMQPPKTKDAVRGTIHASSFNNIVTFTVRSAPLPKQITDYLIANQFSIKRMLGVSLDRKQDDDEITVEDNTSSLEAQDTYKPPNVIWEELENLFSNSGYDWKNVVDNIVAFGPKRVGANILVDKCANRSLRNKTQIDDRWQKMVDESIENGFQTATNQGPLCAEPMVGMAYFLEKVEIEDKEGLESNTSQTTGSLISSSRDAIRNSMLDWSPRLMLAEYSCEIQASTEVLGRVYAVVSRRRGRIIAEEMKEGTTFFTVKSRLPVVESFGFADEIRKRTSGAASPQLIFSGFEIFDIDPFWVPSTEEELEDLGVLAERENAAKKYVDLVRERKAKMSSENIITEALENQYLDEEDSEGSSLKSDVAGDDLGFRIESDSSGSEYNQDEFGEEDSDSEHESGQAQKTSEIEVDNDPYQGQDFDKLVNALKESDHVATGKSAAQQWEKSIEEEMIDFSDIRDELRGASGVGKRRKKLKDRTQVLPPEIRDLIGQANVHYVLNEFDAAIEKIEQVLTTFPEAKSAWTLAASIKTDMGEHDASLRLRVIAALIPPCDSDVWKDLAGESRSQGATQQAVYCLSQAIKYNKYDFDAIWDRFERVGDHRIEFGMGVFELDPDMRISLGQARLELGERDEAKRHFSHVLKLDLEANVALYGEVGNSFMKHEMFEDALEVFKVMEDNERTCSTPVYRNLAVCHKALNNLDMAEQIFEHVCQLEPDNMDVTMQLAETYEALGKREQALATISKILYRSKETQKSSSVRRGQVQEEVLGNANNKASLLTETYIRKTPGMKKLPGEDRKTMRDMAMRVEEEREAEMKINWEKITQLDEKLDMHNREIVEEWLNAAREVLEIYRDTVQLFPKNKNQKFKGMILNQKANSGRKPKDKDPQDQLDEDARRIAVRLERALVDQQHIPKIQEEGVQYFRHIHFDDWVDLTLKYAILNTRYSNYEEADEVLKHMSLSNALNTPERQSALKFCRLVCASMASDIATVVEVSRQYIFDEQFGIEGLRMLCIYLGRSHEGLMGFTEVNLQKFLLREVKMFDVMATGSGFKISNKKHRLANTNETDNVEEEVEKARDNFREANLPIPTEQNPYYLGFYGQIMLAAKSAQTSIYYLLRAYELEPNDYVICLSLTCAYLYRAFQRQADNRHHLIGQAAAFLNRYRDLRGECDEVEYNYGRFYHQLGLLGIATKHYEKVLKIENAKHTSEAAFNLWLIYYATNARGPMKSISDKYLRPEKFKKNDILV